MIFYYARTPLLNTNKIPRSNTWQTKLIIIDVIHIGLQSWTYSNRNKMVAILQVQLSTPCVLKISLTMKNTERALTSTNGEYVAWHKNTPCYEELGMKQGRAKNSPLSSHWLPDPHYIFNSWFQMVIHKIYNQWSFSSFRIYTDVFIYMI